MGKWDALKGKLPAFEVEPEYQQKVDEAKLSYVALDAADMARAYKLRREAKRDLEEIISSHNLHLEALSQLLINNLEAESLQKIQLGTGETVFLQSEPYSSVIDKKKLMDYIKKNKMTDCLIVHFKTLGSLNKERLINGQAPLPGTKVFIKTAARIRGGNDNEE